MHVEPDAEKATNDGAARDQRSNKERLEQAVCVHVVKAKDACCSKYAPEVIRSPWFKYTAWLVSGVAMSGGLYYLAHGLGSISVYSAGCDSKQPDISSSMYVYAFKGSSVFNPHHHLTYRAIFDVFASTDNIQMTSCIKVGQARPTIL